MSLSAGGGFQPNADYNLTGTIAFSGPVSLSGATSYTGAITVNPASSATGSVQALSSTSTLTGSAYGASSHEDQWYSKLTLTPTSTITAANGLNAIRGEVNLTTGKSLTTGFVTGVYGRGNIFGTVAIGSGDLAAVYAKFDLNGSTLTSGHIAPLQANIVNPPATAAATTDLIYAESASGTSIKSILSGYATAAYAFDLTDVSTAFISLTGTCTTPGVGHGWIRVLLNGSVRYIALSAGVS